MTDLSGYASPYNWQSDYVKQSKKPKQIMFHDLTLEGDGEEMAGVTISVENKVELARRLADIGIPRLSILGNSPWPSARDIRVAETIAALDLAPDLGSFVKTEEEIRLTAKIGLDCVSILVWVNDSLLPPNVNGKEPNCDEFAIADSVGVASPFGFRCLIEHVTGWTDKPIQVHCHNHSSMAVANALGAVLGGATVLHTTVNGLGEFAGLLALEEVAVALSMHLGVATGIEYEKLTELSAFVAGITGVENQLLRPVVGAHAFCVPETEEIQQALYELAQAGMLDDSLTFPPALVGNRFRMAIGRRCNEFTVRYNLWAKGFETDAQAVADIVAAVRREAGDGDGYYQMTEERFMQVVKDGGYELRPAA
jgi:isopropylmalate/homocitrate/citramalate synthase